MQGNRLIIIKEDGSREILHSNSWGGVKVSFAGQNALCEIHESIIVKKEFKIHIGEKCYCSIGSNVKIIRGDANITYEGGTFIIGEGTTIGGIEAYGNHEKHLEIIIGKRCMISYGLLIRASDAHAIYDLATPDVCINKASFGCHIDDDVWIGQNVTLLKDANIPSFCVIGAGSVVGRKQFPEHCIIAGNPAKIVRENISWSRRKPF